MTANVPHPYLDGMAEQWIASHAISWTANTAIVYAITRSEDGCLLGTVSLTEIADQRANLGYWIGVPFWGQGYCTEAAAALRDFAFQHRGLRQLYARHLRHNTASANVIKKCGFRYIDDRQFGESRVCHYELDRRIWLT